MTDKKGLWAGFLAFIFAIIPKCCIPFWAALGSSSAMATFHSFSGLFLVLSVGFALYTHWNFWHGLYLTRKRGFWNKLNWKHVGVKFASLLIMTVFIIYFLWSYFVTPVPIEHMDHLHHH